MITLLGALIGCVAYAHPVNTHTHYAGHNHYVTYVAEQSYWVPGHYDSRGYWVGGGWVRVQQAPPRRPRSRSSDCHRHADGRTHCGRH